MGFTAYFDKNGIFYMKTLSLIEVMAVLAIVIFLVLGIIKVKSFVGIDPTLGQSSLAYRWAFLCVST